jgi:hypothetical protein
MDILARAMDNVAVNVIVKIFHDLRNLQSPGRVGIVKMD